VVVSDGSTDRSVEIARAITEVTTVVFEHNRGYGSAIQEGWAAKPAEYLAFLDGDGTCDASFFAQLLQAMHDQSADIALGSRMGSDSEMPRLRRVGNWIFALLLGLLSRQRITDSASGMRIVRRTALKRLGPLPTGLHFTPAMSARAVMSGIKVVEVPMRYSERVGRSKLSVLKDGLRFLYVILGAAGFIRPSRLTLPLIAALVLAAVGIMALPASHYLTHSKLEEWMIYRFLFSSMIGVLCLLMFCATLVAEHVIALGLLQYQSFASAVPWWWDRRGLRLYLAISVVGLLLGLYLVLPGLESWLATGTISYEQMHWSRVIVAALTGIVFVQLIAADLLVALLGSVHARQSLLLEREE